MYMFWLQLLNMGYVITACCIKCFKRPVLAVRLLSFGKFKYIYLKSCDMNLGSYRLVSQERHRCLDILYFFHFSTPFVFYFTFTNNIPRPG